MDGTEKMKNEKKEREINTTSMPNNECAEREDEMRENKECV